MSVQQSDLHSPADGFPVTAEAHLTERESLRRDTDITLDLTSRTRGETDRIVALSKETIAQSRRLLAKADAMLATMCRRTKTT